MHTSKSFSSSLNASEETVEEQKFKSDHEMNKWDKSRFINPIPEQNYFINQFDIRPTHPCLDHLDLWVRHLPSSHFAPAFTLLLNLFFHHVDDFIRNSKVLYRTSANVTFWHPPKPITILDFFNITWLSSISFSRGYNEKLQKQCHCNTVYQILTGQCGHVEKQPSIPLITEA